MKQTHVIHYLVLACILLGGIATFYYVRQSTNLQLAVGVVTSISYILWGFIHHTIQKDLHRKVVIEYVLVGTIAIVLLATVLLR